MDRREFMRQSALAGAGLMVADRSFSGPLISTHAKKPNIIIILCDDLGYGDVGCFGATMIRTPNIDHLANTGAKMTSFYSSAPVCSPSRAGLLTGRYPPRTGVTQVLFPTNGIESVVNARLVTDGAALALPKNEITLGQAMKTGGYRTCCIGKWHLGDMKGFRPHERGFDHYMGLLFSNDMLPLNLYRNSQVIEKAPANQDLLTKKYTEEALWFMKENKNQPFLIYLAQTFPHKPLHASPDFLGKSKAGIYGDCVEEIDWSTGKILDALQSYGLLENTLVVFTSDNGPWWTGNPGYHRGRKNDTFEGGMSVPFLASWPAQIPAGTSSDEMAMNIDLFTTSLAAAGLPVPKDREIDGKDLLPLLSGRQKGSPHDVLYYYKGKALQAVRMGKWKYQLRHYVVYAPLGLPKGPWLFNLEEDPNESYNLIDKYPEVAREFEKRIADWKNNFRKHV